MEMLANLSDGAAMALTWSAIFYCLIGVTLGMIVGVLPGIGPLPAIAMLLPITFYIQPAEAIIMLAGIYYGGQYGGSTASILLNLPGTPAAAVTCLEGYPMARKGRAAVALFMTAIASLWGSIVGIVLVAAFAPALARIALQFGAAEYFSLLVFALLGAAAVGSGTLLRSLAMIVLGLVLGIVGQDVNSGDLRFTFDVPAFADGLNLVAVAMGVFGVSEIIATATTKVGQRPERFSFSAMMPTREEWRRSKPAMARGSIIGSVCGILPGAGAAMASFMAYAVERRISKHPERFGTGEIEGLVAPESANNATAQAAFIPTLTLGIPGDAVMAVMIGALMIHGITPGPTFIADNPTMFWSLVVSFLVGNAMLVVLNIPFVGVWTRLLQVPYHALYPIILVLVAVGVYSINSSVVDILLVAGFGLVGYLLMKLEFPPAPLVLAFILSPMLEENFRRALLLSRGDATVFLRHPISAAFLAVSALIVVGSIVGALRFRRRGEGAGS